MLLSAQLPVPYGLNRPTMYISTETPLSTSRLAQILRYHPRLASLASSSSPPNGTKTTPSLDAVYSIMVPDMESQDHILRYQVPVSVRRHKIGLVVIDSVTANYRAEFEARRGDSANLARRSAELVRLGALLRDLAWQEDVAVVVANQVSDRIPKDLHPRRGGGENITGTSSTQQPPDSSWAPSRDEHSSLDDLLTLDHQQRWFTGWGDEVCPPPLQQQQPQSTQPLPLQSSSQLVATPSKTPHHMHPQLPNMKTPSLGHAWTLQLSARIVLFKEPIYTYNNNNDADNDDGERGEYATRESITWKRRLRVVFAPWVDGGGRGVEFEISREGVSSVST